MSEPDAVLKRTVRDFLESRGCHVQDIPRDEDKTPDLCITGGSEAACLLELKTKTHNDEEMRSLNDQLGRGGIVTRSKSTNHWNTLDGVITSGVKQLSEKDPSREILHFVWVHCSGFDADLYELRLRATIYGTQKLISMQLENVITCYYFWDSSFFRHREALDGVVISHRDQAQLNINDHSLHFSAATTSVLARALEPRVFYPKKYVSDPDVMIYDAPAKRDDEATALKYLRTKYSVKHLQTVNMGMHSGMMRIPQSLDNG
jgi:hypothetical protein